MPGGYGEGDRFPRVPVPEQRRIAGRVWRSLAPYDLEELLRSDVHEERLTAVHLLVRQYGAGDAERQAEVVRVVLANLDALDNWDLVDTLAPHVLGPWLLDRDRAVLDGWAASGDVWRRRLAGLTTSTSIREGEYAPTLALARRLLHDPHDLVHKAVGWMPREVGKRDRAVPEDFLVEHAAAMPAVMLRYAVEKLPAERRRLHLQRRRGALCRAP